MEERVEYDIRTLPERIDDELRTLRIEVERLRDELDYLHRLVHKYINGEAQVWR